MVELTREIIIDHGFEEINEGIFIFSVESDYYNYNFKLKIKDDRFFLLNNKDQTLCYGLRRLNGLKYLKELSDVIYILSGHRIQPGNEKKLRKPRIIEVEDRIDEIKKFFNQEESIYDEQAESLSDELKDLIQEKRKLTKNQKL